MKSKALLFVLLFAANFSVAQNWNCFLPGTKQYFTNANNYLRGMRIDSVRTNGTDTIYYPFHTLRGNYMYTIPATDSNGGSWLGKKVIQKTDGTFLFDDRQNETVIIKTMANVGDSWIFYDDTGSVYYMANVTTADTMTVLGNLDSIKTISITVYNASSIISTNPINNLNIVLSKNHGFVKTIDLYTFPYKDSSDYATFYDYYFHMAQLPAGTGPMIGIGVINALQEFTLVPFHYPTATEIYDYNAGDMFYRTTYSRLDYAEYETGSSNIDSIISRTSTPDTIIYQTKSSSEGYTSNHNHVNHSGISTGTNVIKYSNNLLFDTTKMPEEWNVHYNYYYQPNDTSNCYVSSTYEADADFINGISGLPYLFEYCGVGIQKYKTGIGLVEFASYVETSNTNMIQCNVSQSGMSVCKKNGMVCSSCYLAPVAINTIDLKNSIEIYPNPANDELYIKMPDNASHTICLLNMLGQTVYSLQTGQQENSISISGLPAGVYIIKMADEKGAGESKKVIIQH